MTNWHALLELLQSWEQEEASDLRPDHVYHKCPPMSWARLPPDTVTRRKENIKPLRSPEGKPSHLKLPWFMPQYKYASHSSFPIQNTHKWQWHLVGLSHGQGGPSKLKGRSKSLERVVWAHRDELDALSLGHECTQPTYSVFLAIPRPERSKHRHLSLFY